jgi:hypothetical protein
LLMRLLREIGLPERIAKPMTTMSANLLRRFRFLCGVSETFRATNGVLQLPSFGIVS